MLKRFTSAANLVMLAALHFTAIFSHVLIAIAEHLIDTSHDH